MPGDPPGGVTACRYCGAHNLENVSCGCVGYGLVRRPSIECLGFWCREELLQPESGHQAVVKQLDLFGLPGSKHPTPELAWQQLPEKTRETVTGLVARLLIDHQRRDRGPNPTGRRGDV
jgi:hypothetical protein